MTRIFLSYGRKDEQQARKLYQRLQSAGFDPWMDKENLLPGEMRKTRIHQALEHADFFLACLSSRTITQRGALQRAIRQAVDLWQEKLADDIYLIPVKLDDCEVPSQLQPFQWVNLYDEPKGWQLLEKAIRAGIQQRGSTPPDTPAASPIPRDACIHKVRNRMHDLLRPSHMQSLRDAITQRTGGKSAAEGLLPLPSAPLIETLIHLHVATKSCLLQLAEQHPERIDQTKDVAKAVLGWLVVLAVDQEQVRAAGIVFDPWQGGIDVMIPVALEAGIEVLVSSLGDRGAWFELKYDKTYGEQAIGRGSLRADDLEMGIGPTDQLTEVLKRIWVEVMKTEAAPPRFEDKEHNMLQAKLSGDEKYKENHYYITVAADRSSSPLADSHLLTRLLAVQPLLRVFYVGGGQGEGLLVLNEYELSDAIVRFLLMLRDTP